MSEKIDVSGEIESLASQAVLDEFGAALHSDEAVVLRVVAEGEFVTVSYTVHTHLAGRVFERMAAIRQRIRQEIEG